MCPSVPPGPASPRCGRRRALVHDRGSVTAETAMALPVLVVVLAAAVGVLACVAAQLRCVDAARAAAREAARGESSAAVREAGQRVAPADARVTLQADGDTVEVVVSAEVRPFGGVLDVLPPVAVRARAVAALEPVS